MEFIPKENGWRVNVTYGELHISGDDTFGYRPYQLMIASIVGCSGSVFCKILEKQRISIDGMSIKADVERNAKEANRIESISLRFIVKGKNLNREKLNKNLRIARKNCAMVRSVEKSIHITEEIQIIE